MDAVTKKLIEIVEMQNEASKAKNVDAVLSEAIGRMLDGVSRIIEAPVVTYTAEQLSKVLHTTVNNIALLRNLGALKGMKLGNKYIYRVEEVKKFLKEFDGMDLSNEKETRIAVRQVYGQPILKQKNVNTPSKVNSRV